MSLKILFGHAAFSDNPQDLSLIKFKREINLVSIEIKPFSMTHSYLNDLNLQEDFSHVPYDERGSTLKPFKTLATFNYSKNDAPDLEQFTNFTMNLFPKRQELQSFAQDILRQTQIFTQVLDVENIASVLYINFPKETSEWHGDIQTDIRGFRTWKGMPTLWRAQETVTDWTQLKSVNHNLGFHGYEDNIPEGESLYKGAYNIIPQNNLSIWKGQLHGRRALIHAEPVKSDNESPRLIQALHIPN